MRKSVFLLSVLLACNWFTITKGSKTMDSLDEQIDQALTFKDHLKRHALKLYKDAVEDKEMSDFLLKKKLDKYFKVPERQKVKEICSRLEIQEKWLYDIIWFESRGNPKAVNKQEGDPKNPIDRIKLGRATGIIQFMPKTARGLSTTTAELYEMSIIDQLDYVEAYLNKWNKRYKLTSYIDTYLAVFYPAALGKSHDYIIGTGKIVEQNKAVDVNKDGKITKEDFIAYATI